MKKKFLALPGNTVTPVASATSTLEERLIATLGKREYGALRDRLTATTRRRRKPRARA